MAYGQVTCDIGYMIMATEDAKKKVIKKKSTKKQTTSKKTAKKVTKKVTKKNSTQAKAKVDKDFAPEVAPAEKVSMSETVEESFNLKLSVSKSLHSKLKMSAESEGISVEDFITEILAEGVTVRAWEIIERKAAMKSPSSGQQSQYINSNNHNNNNNNNRRGGKNKNRGRMNHNRYNNLMGDKTSFMEYVRNTEPRG